MAIPPWVLVALASTDGHLSATASIPARECRTLDASASVGVSPDGPSASERADLCLIAPIGERDKVDDIYIRYDGASVSEHAELGALPALSARRELRGATYSGAGARAFAGLILANLGEEVNTVEQGGDQRNEWIEEIDFLPLWKHVTPLVATTDVVFGPHQLVIVDAEILQLRDLHIGPLSLEASFAVSGTGTFTTQSDGEPPKTWATNAVVPDITLNTPRVSVRLDLPHLSAGADLDGRVYPTFDDEIAAERRVSGFVAVRHRDLDLRAEGFAALTSTWPSGQPRENEATGGGAVKAELHRGRTGLQLGVEVARSFYASLDGAVDPRPALAARATLGLSVASR